ncbi:MAG: NPCBM/NEW2 domain-containing protein [bacterium]
MRKPDSTSAADTWEGKFMVDPSTPETHVYLKNLFTTLSNWGYDYFKIDGQPIVTREFRNKKEFMKNPADDTDALYRQTLQSIREAIGPNRYLLGCWLVPLEGIGLMNGSRTSADVEQEWKGFKVALRATMRYFFLHNIAWYCDPDVMIVRHPMPFEQAQAWATLQGLTGQALMSSDRLIDLSEDRLELMRRVYPAVDIRSMDLFSAQRNKRIWDLKINHLGRQYDVVGLFNYEKEKSVPIYVSWNDLDLPSDKPVHVFDFWNKEYLGAWEKGIAFDMPPTSCRVLTLLPDNDQVQLISTSRHITQGWVDLLEAKYEVKNSIWSGKSKVVKNDPYALRFAFPRGKNFVVKNAKAKTLSGNLPVKISNHDGWASVEMVAPQNTEVRWEVAFAPAEMYHFPTKPPQNLWAERAGFDGVNLRWVGQHQPYVGYLISVNGELLGFTSNQIFPLRSLNIDSTYSVEVRTAWQDGAASEKAAELKFTLKPMVPDEIYLSDLEPYQVGLEWRHAQINRTVLEKGMVLGGKPYERGLGIPPNSELGYELKGLFQTFSALVGVDDEHNREGHVEFVVLGDGKELWRSGFVTKANGAIPVQLDVSGVNRLILRVNRGEKGGSGDQANWVEAKIIRRSAANN